MQALTLDLRPIGLCKWSSGLGMCGYRGHSQHEDACLQPRLEDSGDLYLGYNQVQDSAAIVLDLINLIHLYNSPAQHPGFVTLGPSDHEP